MDDCLDGKEVEVTCEEVRQKNQDVFAAPYLHIFAGGGDDDAMETEAYASFGRSGTSRKCRSVIQFENNTPPNRRFFEQKLGSKVRGFYHYI